ncbi:MAG: adenylyltransferase/cytidyltransferase family protein, partial [bacterium]|nr:adenylyltransferase/cytidyltransferase family protein [bacterium]
MRKLENKIRPFEEVCKVCKKLQKQGNKTVFVHGFFDILHKGHVTLLIEAKKLGDILIVGVDHDYNAKRIKGPNRPINDHDSRMFIISNIQQVNFVFLIPPYKELKTKSKFFVEEIYDKLRPDIVATSINAGKHGYLKKQAAEHIGAKFVDIDHTFSDINTTKILEKIINL